MCDEDVTTEAMDDIEWAAAKICLMFAVIFLVPGLFVASLPFHHPSTTARGFTSDAVPTINDQGDIDCGGSSLRVVLHGPRVAIPPGDLASRAEKACRDDAVENVGSGIVIGLPGVAFFGWWFVMPAWRYRAERRAEGPGDSGDNATLAAGPARRSSAASCEGRASTAGHDRS